MKIWKLTDQFIFNQQLSFSVIEENFEGSTSMYEMWQFNSWNDSVKAKFAYLVIIGCCYFQIIPFVKLHTLWDNGTIFGNIL